MIEFQLIFRSFANLSAALILLIAALHIVTTFFGKKIPVKLDRNSLVILTGGCMGIGRQMALELARLYNCRLLIIDRRKDLFAKIEQEIKEAGGSCECRFADLGNKESVHGLNKYILGRNQKIDMFVYNAGIVFTKKGWQITEEEHELLMRVNYFTPVAMINALQPLLEGNHVAVTASVVSVIPGSVDMSAYVASKRAIYGYLSSLRQEYKKEKKNITISMGCPYMVRTTMFEGFKTKLEFFLRTLDEGYVGKRLAKEFVQKKEVCFVYQYEAMIFKLVQFLPSQVNDWAMKMLDSSDYQQLQKRQQANKGQKND